VALQQDGGVEGVWRDWCPHNCPVENDKFNDISLSVYRAMMGHDKSAVRHSVPTGGKFL